MDTYVEIPLSLISRKVSSPLCLRNDIEGLKTSHVRLTMASASMIAKLIHTIHPFDPEFQSSTGPGAHLWCLDNGDRIAHPSIAPSSI
jgi:hypothetical protein